LCKLKRRRPEQKAFPANKRTGFVLCFNN
jgi:hypothetical protein